MVERPITSATRWPDSRSKASFTCRITPSAMRTTEIQSGDERSAREKSSSRFLELGASAHQVLVGEHGSGEVGDGAGEELLVGGPCAPLAHAFDAHHAAHLALAPDARVEERDHAAVLEIAGELARARIAHRVGGNDGAAAQERLEIAGVGGRLEFLDVPGRGRAMLAGEAQAQGVGREQPDRGALHFEGLGHRARERLPGSRRLHGRDAALQQAEQRRLLGLDAKDLGFVSVDDHGIYFQSTSAAESREACEIAF